MKKSNRKGFTIVELVIVIAVIAILAAVLIPTFSNIIKKANVSSDTQIIRNANTALAADLTEHKTMAEALEAAEDYGLDISKINAKATGNEILWDSANDVFCYYNADTNKVEYIPETTLTTTADETELWEIIDVTDANPTATISGKKWSLYARSATVDAITVSTGFDAGDCTNFTSITYTNSEDAQEVVIRTNGGTLKIVDTNDESDQEVYGSVDTAEIHTGKACCTIHATVDYLDLKEGKVIAGEGCIIYLMKAESQTAAAEEDGGVIIIPATATTSDIKTTDLPSGYTVTDSGTTQPSGIASKIAKNTGISGSGTESDPFLITDSATIQQISDFYDLGYNYFKVADGVTTIDCSTLEGIYLNGSFDGNGVTFKNLNNDTGIFFQVKTTANKICKVGNFTADSSCKMTRTYGAGIIRQCESNAELYNITSYATVTGTTNHASGLLGYTNNNGGNCGTLLIKDCTINSVVYYTNASCSDGGCAAFVGYAQNSTAVTIQDCTFGGKLYTANSSNVSGGINYYLSQSQDSANLTVIENSNTINKENWKTLTLNTNWFKILVSTPVAEAGTGYKFTKATGAVRAEVIFEIHGKTGSIKGWNFIVFHNENQDISSVNDGADVTVVGLPYFSSATMKRGSLSDSNVKDGVYNIYHETYDEDWLTLPSLMVVQYDSQGNVVGTGTLSLTINLPQD